MKYTGTMPLNLINLLHSTFASFWLTNTHTLIHTRNTPRHQRTHTYSIRLSLPLLSLSLTLSYPWYLVFPSFFLITKLVWLAFMSYHCCFHLTRGMQGFEDKTNSCSVAFACTWYEIDTPWKFVSVRRG